MRQNLFIVAALLAGFVGGILGARIERARERSHPDRVIRARSFELVDEAGRPLSYWGIDRRRYVVLAFGGRESTDQPIARAADLTDPRNQRGAFGVAGDSPVLDFKGTDGTTRIRMNLSAFEKPLLWMGDETGKRLALGVEHTDTPSADDNNWYLRFAPDRAWIGMYVVREGGQQYVKGMLSVSTDKVKYP